ncbi:MAG: methionyl-tRNA formyltransferase [Hyphomicrobium sp.]
MSAPSCPKLSVFVVTEEDPLYVIKFFDVLFREYPAEEIVFCGITIDKPFHEPLPATLRRMISFYGLTGAVRQGARFVQARMRGRSIRSLAEERGIPVLETRSVNDLDFVSKLRALRPDLIVSVAAPEIFSPELLSVPERGCINMHSGRLPEYRGMMPTFWQMLRGEQAVTVTVHTMVPKLDAGDVIATTKFPLRPADSLDRVITGTKQEGARLLIRVLRSLHRNEDVAARTEMAGAPAYYSFPRRSDVRAFRQLGHRML